MSATAEQRTGAVVEQLRERIRQLQAAPRSYLATLRTGVAEVDALLPSGGFPLGQALELCGEAASGRTSLALRAVAAAHREQRLCAWVDGPEGALSAGRRGHGRGAVPTAHCPPQGALAAGVDGGAARSERRVRVRGAGSQPGPRRGRLGWEVLGRAAVAGGGEEARGRGLPWREPAAAAVLSERSRGRRDTHADRVPGTGWARGGGGAQPAGWAGDAGRDAVALALSGAGARGRGVRAARGRDADRGGSRPGLPSRPLVGAAQWVWNPGPAPGS